MKSGHAKGAVALQSLDWAACDSTAELAVTGPQHAKQKRWFWDPSLFPLAWFYFKPLTAGTAMMAVSPASFHDLPEPLIGAILGLAGRETG